MDNNIIKIYKNHKYNISPVLSGGLGNNLFQIAAVYSYAWDMRLNVVVEDIIQPGIGHKNTYSGKSGNLPLRIFEIFPNINCVDGPKYYWESYECQKKDDENPNKVIQLKDSLPKYVNKVKVIGRFISSAFFDHNRQKIMDLLTFSSKLSDYIFNKYKDTLMSDTVSVHIRRGDFIKNIKRGNKRWCLLNTDYYMNAFNLFKDMNVTYVFFSEDDESKDFIKNKLIPLIKHKYIIVQDESAPVDLCFMSMCTHNIIANSTFSIWGAYLNKNKTKIVAAPYVWKKEDNIESLSIKGRIPSDWKIIDCKCTFDF